MRIFLLRFLELAESQTQDEEQFKVPRQRLSLLSSYNFFFDTIELFRFQRV
jgi:hypothetical protein